MYSIRARLSRLPSLLIALPLFYAEMFSQTPPSPTHPQMFQVHGTIADPRGVFLQGTEVRFQNEGADRAVTADGAGRYEIDLPLGSYKMTARSPKSPLLEEYRRPLFRVTSPRRVILNVTL